MESRLYDVMVVGGGAAGAAITRDLSMRGFDVLLVERNKVAGGSSSASHQNLVGGLRYVVKNPTVAAECAEENKVLSRIAPELVGERFNYFVGFRDDYVETALRAAASLGVRADEVDLREAFAEVPGLSKDVDIVVETDDRNLDVRAFCLLNCAVARREGAVVFEDTSISSIKRVRAGEVLAVIGLTYADKPIVAKSGIEEAIRTAIEAVKILAARDEKEGDESG